jgi:hypothetical protein
MAALLKVFESLVPDPKNAKDPNAHQTAAFLHVRTPIQAFFGPTTLRADTLYWFPLCLCMESKETGTAYQYIRLKFARSGVQLRHGVWFNRGALQVKRSRESLIIKAPGNKEINDPRRRKPVGIPGGFLMHSSSL